MFAQVGDRRITQATIHVPRAGVWWGTFVLDEGAELTGQQTVTIGNLSLVGTVRKGGKFAGASRYRIDAGAGAWGREVSARHYQSDAGLRLSTVLGDAARAVGETLASGSEDGDLGSSYVRQRGPARRVLDGLVGASGWYVDNAGQTVIGARPAGTPSSIEVLDYVADERRVTIATEAPGSIAPGQTVTVTDPTGTVAELVVNELVLEVSGGGARAVAYCDEGAAETPFMRQLRALVREMFPRLAFLGTYEYRINGQTGDRYDLQPVDPNTGMPELRSVVLRPGVAGSSAELTTGARVLVQFVDSDPRRPYVCAFEEPGGDGWVPPLVKIDGDSIELGAALTEVLRHGETVDITGVQAGAGVGGVLIRINAATAPAGLSGAPGASKVKA